MKVAIGLKAHSGWAVLVALGDRDGKLQVVDRRRIELVAEAEMSWARQPYHAAEGLKPAEARRLVRRGIAAARGKSSLEMRKAAARLRDAGHEVVACAVLVGEPMPDWSVDQILAVHFRMHQAEGALFREALARAAEVCGLTLVAVPAKQLDEIVEGAVATSAEGVKRTVAMLGKSLGAPWGRDHKEASLAALIAMQSGRS